MAEFPDTSLGMIRGLKSGVHEAWLRYWTRYNQPLCALAKRKGLDAASADDVVQEVHLTLLKNIRVFKPGAGSSFRAWLRWILSKRIADAFRERKIEVTASDRDQLQAAGETPVDLSRQSSDSRRDDLLKALRLSFEEKSVLIFTRILSDGETVKDVAEDLKMKESAVERAFYRVRKRALELGQEPIDESAADPCDDSDRAPQD